MKKINLENFDALLATLRKNGYRLLGPTICDEVIVYDEIQNAADLPVGRTDEQNNGSYHLKQRQDQAYFGYNLGPQSWKKFLHPDKLKLYRSVRDGIKFNIEPVHPDPPKMAFIGVRACELAAMAIHDRVFLNGTFKDSHYAARRDKIFIVAVNCTQAGNTCFCTSMNTGPAAQTGFDLALTEIINSNEHFFIVETGSPAGEKFLKKIESEEATKAEIAKAKNLIEETAGQMGRQLQTEGLRDLLKNHPEHPHWEQIAPKCMACGNCTLVCPTCFCTTVEDVTDLDGQTAERWRKWDSCFNLDFTYIHGGSIRVSAKSRYRQWATHKFSSWEEQFGTSGCVGCGRCITWCPVGIDITQELKQIQQQTKSG